MLLIIQAVLLILAALGQDHRAAVAEQIFPLDMVPNSVDDQYMGCHQKMAHLVKTKYLQMDINNSAKFKHYWQKNNNVVKFPKDHLTKNHLIAIHVYTGKYIYRRFNEDTRYGGKQYKHKSFKWYSLHFLLTDALQILKKQQNKCYVTYRGTKLNFNKHVLNKDIRYGSFTSSSLDPKIAQSFGTKSCFEIYTCEGVSVNKYSEYPDQQEVLIPPYEKFRVTAVRTKKSYNNLWCDTVYTLQSSGRKSYMNCALFKKH